MEEEGSISCFEEHMIDQRSKTDICLCKQCCAISFYTTCFSVIKPCTYWNSDTLDAVIENGNTFYKKLNIGKHLLLNDLPNRLEICDADVDVVFTAQREIILSHNASLSKRPKI